MVLTHILPGLTPGPCTPRRTWGKPGACCSSTRSLGGSWAPSVLGQRRCRHRARSCLRNNTLLYTSEPGPVWAALLLFLSQPAQAVALRPGEWGGGAPWAAVGLAFGVGLWQGGALPHPTPFQPALQDQRAAAERPGAVGRGPGEECAEDKAAAGFPAAPGEGPAWSRRPPGAVPESPAALPAVCCVGPCPLYSALAHTCCHPHSTSCETGIMT